MGGSPKFEAGVADLFTPWGNPAAQNMITLWNSTTEHDRQGTTAKFLGQTNEEVVRSAQANEVQVVTIGSSDDCVWNPANCNLPGRDNTSTQIIENANVAERFELDGNCPVNLLVPSTHACFFRSHSIVLGDSRVLGIIRQAVGSPTVP